MQTYVDWWDKQFGTWIELEAPMPDGTIKKVPVTKKWLEKMQAEGTIEQVKTEVGKRIKVHVLDLVSGAKASRAALMADDWEGGLKELRKDPYRVEYWTVGNEISAVAYDRVKDPKSGDVYAIYREVDGKGMGTFIPKESWDQARKIMQQ